MDEPYMMPSFATKVLLHDIRSAFSEAANSVNTLPMAAYMKNIAPFFGVKSVQRRDIEREIFAATKSLSFDKVCAVIRALYGQPERELQYLAMDWLYLHRKEWKADTIGLIETLITTKSWWDTVDFLAEHCLGEWVLRWPEEGGKAVRQYIHSDNLWLNRSAIIHQLFYKADTDTQLLTDAIMPHILSREFFLQKAIGWALRQYARVNPDWVREFADIQPLMPLSRREALKHL